ncbi:MAG: hypothetical protein AAFX05_00690 [Planctomycetota bacterium]
MKIRCNAVALFAGAMLAPAAMATGLDVYIEFDGGAITTGEIDKDNGFTVTPGVRVFEGELGTEGPGQTDDPGFFANTLPVGAQIGVNFIDGLRKWDGSSFPYAAETMTLEKGIFSATTPVGAGSVPGFVFAEADGSGFFDDHPEYILDTPASTGVFLLSLEVFTPSSGIDNSEPIYIVFGNGVDDSQIDAGVDYVNNVIIPAPSAVAACAPLALLGLRRRR